MLKAIAVVSANDCSVAMAEFIGGSEEDFVDMMNNRAIELGMNDTAFKNCHGTDEDGHLPSAHDIAVMSRELIKHEKIFEYTTIWMDSLRDGKSELVNTNKLLKTYTGANGLKTGSTSLAKYNLSATAKRGNMQLIGVIMKAPTTADRFSDAKKLLDYGFANYNIEKLNDKGEVVGTYEVKRGIQDTVNGITEVQLTKLFKKGANKNIETEIVVDDVVAPMQAGDKIGEIIYKQNGEEIARCNIVLESSIDKITFGKVLSDLMNKWVRFGR
jgi:D-alanyl-D-alanine carboxypeptidase (penicillin-binding protein 5/6)